MDQNCAALSIGVDHGHGGSLEQQDCAFVWGDGGRMSYTAVCAVAVELINVVPINR